MENPHNERQAILLQRIVKSVVRAPVSEQFHIQMKNKYSDITIPQTKCNDIFQELNQCLEEIVQANEEIRLGADLASKHRKNAQFNIEALRASGALPSHSTLDARGGKTPTPDDPQP